MAERARGVNRRDAGSGYHRDIVRNDPGGRRIGHAITCCSGADLLKG
ncbi:hypothetical protein [Rhodovulum sulfidophilum]|uniref:Uncharacterized protein n=1 Tax=Rhodovulum sulfidophilum TaxID=35806 RepID=A0ABS1RT79_RHOSU|nr:hypothetical protein [Rhodovulum sulfidophilum]MBL3608737.1 hypothetical protein [Rhodovulum sulfidophilum]MCE8458605.1 hypothetical protein [Rhodovulum sulfidophilum]